MQIETNMKDELILRELGGRVREKRVDKRISQADLARIAGVGKSTVQRLEAGHSVEMKKFIRVLRGLDLIEVLNVAFPEQGIRPMDLLKAQKKTRQRSSRPRNKEKAGKAEEWKWGDEE